jgi:hypothetical protein
LWQLAQFEGSGIGVGDDDVRRIGICRFVFRTGEDEQGDCRENKTQFQNFHQLFLLNICW